MNVLIINTVPFNHNGITSVILNYFRNMNLYDMSMDFLSIGEVEDNFRKEIEEKGCNIYIIPRRKKKIFSYFFKLKRLLKSRQYDVVHVHGNSAMMSIDLLPIKLCNVPVRIAHSHNTTCSSPFLHKMLYPLFRWCYTDGFACGVEAGTWLFRKEDFKVIKNGINLDQYSYNEEIRKTYRHKLGIHSEKVLGHVGLFNYQKNHEFLIEIFEQLLELDSNYHLVLIGVGDNFEQVKRVVSEKKLDKKITFLGKVDDVYHYLQAIDLFLLPSRFEGLPLALVEAQAAGLPCFVSDKVSSEAKMSSGMKFLPIDQGAEVWVSEITNYTIQNRLVQSKEASLTLSKSGYDIKRNALELQGIYKHCVIAR